jgi:hypothetical protein
MSVQRGVLLVLMLMVSVAAFSQDEEPAPKYQYFLTLSGNLYLPVKNADKSTYPILGYSKKTDPNLQVGGMGLGLSMFRAINEKFSLKGQLNLARHAYWNKPIEVVNPSGQPLGSFLSSSFNYSAGLLLTVQYFLTEKFSVGTGFGAEVLLVSETSVPENNSSLSTKHSEQIDRYYRLIMPVLPIEASLKLTPVLLNVRYEYGLANAYRNDLGFDRKDKYGLLVFEVGYKIR